jgi:Mn-containing catalase
VPWTAAYINGDVQGELTSDLRSNMGAETRAKMVYEYLIQFTNDPYVIETLRFLMTREVAHYQMFEAALGTITPNFPMGTLQSDPRYSNLYFNMSTGNELKGPWNQGQSTQLAETWQFIQDPVKHVLETNSLLDQKAAGTDRTEEGVQAINEELGKAKKEFINAAAPAGPMQWNEPLNAADMVDGLELEDENISDKTNKNKGSGKSND